VYVPQHRVIPKEPTLSAAEVEQLAERLKASLSEVMLKDFSPEERRYIAARWCHADSGCKGCTQAALYLLHLVGHMVADPEESQVH
jgi:hypothetical protein